MHNHITLWFVINYSVCVCVCVRACVCTVYVLDIASFQTVIFNTVVYQYV